MDGFITIGTKLETDKFDKQVAALEKKIKEEEEKKIKIDAEVTNLEEEIRNYDEARTKVMEYKQELKRLNEEKAQMLKADPSMAVAVDTPEYARVKQDIMDINNLITEEQAKIDKQGPAIDKVAMKLEEAKNKQSKINEKVDEFKQKIENVNLQKQQAEINKMKTAFTGVNSSIQKGVSKLGRMAISVLGIYSGLAMLRRASSELANYDSEYAAKLEYIRFVLTQAIAPILYTIVDWAMKLLNIIGGILQALFGINIFEKGSVDNFKKMKENAGGVAKAAREINKQLAGFDEMNVLQDNGDTSRGGGGGGTNLGNIPDLSSMQGEPPTWLKWIIDNKDIILAVLAGIAAGILAIKLGLTGIKALGFGLIVAGIVYAVEGLLKYLKDPSWENFGQIIQGIGIAVIGFGIIIGGIPAIVIGAVLLIVGTIIRYWEQIKGFLERGIGWLKGKSDFVGQKFGGWVKGLYDTFVGFLELIVRFFDGTFNAIKRIFDGVIQFFQGVFTGDWNKAWEGIKNIVGGVIEWCTTRFKVFFDWVDRVILTPLKSLIDAVVGGIQRALNLGGQLPNLAGGIEVAVNAPRFKTGGIVTIPKLASGGVVNMPNRGTLVGGGTAIAGEAGREGIIPLTDAQAMSELGEAIGRNVLVNLTNIMSMNGRVIGRELKRIQSEQDFAYNT